MRGDEISRAGRLLCESESRLAHRAASVVEGFILVSLWSLFIWFLYLLVLAFTRGNLDPSFFYLILWGVATLALTWHVLTRLKDARPRVYSESFVLPRKESLLKDVLVPYGEIESLLEASNDHIDIRWRGKEYVLSRQCYKECFRTLRAMLNEKARF